MFKPLPAHLWTHLPYFSAVARLGSFTLAAEQLHITQSAVSYQVKQLEDKLDVLLLVRRSGSRLHLTPAGQQLAGVYQYCEVQLQQVMAELKADSPSGQIRLTAPVDFASFILPAVLAYLRQVVPDLKVLLHVSDELVDVAEERFDFAIRSTPTGQHLQHDLLGKARKSVVASAAYLAAYGVPENLTDLAQHILLIRSEQLTMSWNQLSAEAQLVLPSTWQNQVLGNSFALEQGAKAGLGLALLVDFVVVGAVQRGELQTVLQAWTAPLHTDFYLSYVPAPQLQVVHKLLLKALQTVLQVQFSTAFVMN